MPRPESFTRVSEAAPERVAAPRMSAEEFAEYEPPPGYTCELVDGEVVLMPVPTPDDRAIAMEEKVAQYLAAGARLVWVINPKRRTATAHAPDAPPRALVESDTLDGGDVVPGFACALREALDW